MFVCIFLHFLCFFVFFLDFHGFCCDLVILGSYFDILGILGIWEKMCSVGFSLVFEFLFCWGILLSRVSFLFGAAQEKKPTNNNKPGVWWTEGVGFGISSIASSSLGDRKKGYP